MGAYLHSPRAFSDTLKCNGLGQVPMKYIMKLFISSIRSKKLTTKAKE